MVIFMNIAIIGLGLIGGSIARALKHETSDTVMGYDINKPTIYKAKLLEAIDCELTDERLSICDYVIIALYPKDTVEYVKANCTKFKKGAIVMDCCGIKKYVYDELSPLAEQNSFVYVGAHPMAGIERSGFENSTHRMFNNASIVITPPKNASIELLGDIKKFWGAIGFTNLEVTTPENHDRIIAYTSQLAHVVSSAYIKSPTAMDHSGFSAGSYKDMTRVARLNEKMWTELFLENRDYLLDEIKDMINSLEEYKKALENSDSDTLLALLKDGRERKIAADRKDLKE